MQNGPLRRDLSELLRLAGPVVVTRLGVMAMGLTDTVVVGRFSTVELSYMALGWAPTAVILMTAMGLLSGVQVMTARFAGAGREAETGAVLRRGLVYAFWLGVAATTLMFAAGPAFLRVSGIEADLVDGSARALKVLASSMVPSLMGIACSAWLESKGRPGDATVAMWVANGVNLAVDLVLVPGGFGLPAMGAVGAGLSTAAARTLLLVMLIGFVWRLPEGRAGLLRKPAHDPATAAEQRHIGYGAGAAFFVESAAFSGMNIVAGWVGGLAVAGWAIVLNLTSIVFMGPLGLAMAASVLVARAFGAGDWPGVARAGVISTAATVALTGAVSLVVWPASGLIAAGYTRDPALASLAGGALALTALFMIADGLQVVSSQMLRARGDVWVSTVIQVASYAVVMLPLGWALALPAGLGLKGIVIAVIVASFMSAGLLVTRFAALARHRRVV